MNSTGKKIGLLVIVVAVVGTILYLESIKAPHQTAVSVIQSIENSTSSTPNATGTPARFIASRTSTIAQEEKQYQAAPEITDPTGFINTQPFTLASLVGKKVVLLDFWTYSCINCLRTLPYLNAWYQKYASSGLVVVGIHTPEFAFEHDIANVQAAVQKYNIQYPVVLDNNMGTWDAYGNLYWPHEYLINIDGFIVHDQVGEGSYNDTEMAIQQALAQRDEALGIPTSTIPTGLVTPTSVIAIDYDAVASPETYFGAARNEYLANGVQGQGGVQTLSIPSTIALNSLYLGGTWDFEDQYTQNESAGATIVFQYDSKNVYMVAAASSTPVTIQVSVDGQPVGAAAGADVSATSSTATIQANRLYNLIQGSSYGMHTLEITVENPGLQAYTFTFG